MLNFQGTVYNRNRITYSLPLWGGSIFLVNPGSVLIINQHMIIQNSAVNIMFPRVDNIKKHYILNEVILKENFNEATILPIPDDAPLDIPRILVTSKGEHSQLNIAPSAVNLQTLYTDSFTTEWGLCENYLNERIGDVFKLTDVLTEKNYNYIGVVANLIWDDVEKSGDKVLYKNLFEKNAQDNLSDLLVKYTYVEDEKYFVNITLQSLRIFGEQYAEIAGAFSQDNLKGHSIGITLEINDRYLFNVKKNYKSSKQKYDEIMILASKIINDKMGGLVEKGVY